MKHISLFNGIGGFQLAAQWMGWENVASCEIDLFCNKITKYHFPNCIQHGDIKTTDFTIYRGTIDVLTGGFPCQPFSVAGQRKGTEDDRHLWPEMLRAIREIQPSYIVGENVSGIVNWDGGVVFEQVCVDLENEGYEVQPVILPACAVNAPHRRDRVWFIAYRKNERYSSGSDYGSAGREGVKGQQIGDNAFRSQSVGHSGIDSKSANKFDWGNTEKQSEWRGLKYMFDTIGVTPDTNNNGCERVNSQHEVNPSERGFDALNDVEQVVTTDSEGKGISGLSERKETQHGINGINGDAADTSRSGWVQNDIKQQTAKSEHAISGWDNFPTQPPICERNDGVSGGLVSITFPKWRAESIKAMGNAIVPQVAYQIFKAIESTL